VADVDQLGVLVGLIEDLEDRDRGPGAVEDDQRGGGGVVGVADDHLQVVLVVPGGDGVGGELLALMAIPSA
jgi:hypothetical protein